MRWAGHVACMGERGGCIGSCWGNRRGGDHWGDLGIDGWIILGWISSATEVSGSLTVRDTEQKLTSKGLRTSSRQKKPPTIKNNDFLW